MAHWMASQLGLPTKDEPVAYMGIGDSRYLITILAAMKTGYKVLLTSPRNSPEGQLFLLESTQCRKFLFTSELQGQVDALARQVTLKPVQVPELDDLLAITEPVPYGKGHEGHDVQHEDDIALILHSSGSTGWPKPIYIRVGALAVVDTIKEMAAPNGRRNVHDELYAPTLMVSMMPFFFTLWASPCWSAPSIIRDRWLNCRRASP